MALPHWANAGLERGTSIVEAADRLAPAAYSQAHSFDLTRNLSTRAPPVL